MLKKIFYIILLLCPAFYSRAQNTTNLIFSQINEENGLSDNHVTCVLKDKQGLVWIGTEDGLNLLNGSSIKVFKHRDKDSTSISNNAINAIKEDEDGNIWIATSLGLNCYNKKTQRFINYYLAASPYSTSAIIFSIAIDGQFIWCGTDGGLFKFKKDDGSSIFFLCGKEEPVTNQRFCNKTNYVLLDENKICWLCTAEGLWSFNTKNNSFKKEIAAGNDPYYNPLFLTALNEGTNKLWVGNWQYGLKLFDKKTGRVTSFFNKPGSPSAVYSIAKVPQPDGSDLFWLNGHLNGFNPATTNFFQYKKPLLLPEYPVVKSNYVSPDNWVWTCTDQGLYIYNPQRQLFNTLVYNSSITSQEVMLNPVKNNLLLCGQGDSILMEYDSSLKLVHNFSDMLFKNNPGKKRASAALAMIKVSDSRWWLSTSEGIVNFDLATGYTKWFEHKATDSTSLPRNFINYLFFDSQKKLWIFPWRGGVWQMDTTSGKCNKIFEGFPVTTGLTKKLVIADAAEDDEGNLWLCDLDEGIIFYDRKANSFTRPFTKQIGAGAHTERIYKYGGYFYSLANNIIVKWKDKNNCVIKNFPPEIEKFVYDFAPDQQGNWWFATKNGLIYFNEDKNIFKRFSTADGLYSNDLNAIVYCAPNGKIILGGLFFLTAFNPQKIVAASQIVPPLLFTNFTVNGNNVIAGSNTINLDYNNNNLLFEWALPDYTNPFRNQYYCRLQGIDSGWRYVGNKGEVQYANLSPGNYTIVLRAANANGDFANENISIHFIIHPPFWKTGWFLLSCLLVAGIFIYRTFKIRIKSIQKKAALQQQMSELEMKALRAQMNPHFIFNSLNSIQECIISKNTDAAYGYLSQFSKLVRRILENSGKETVPLKEEQELMQWYLSLEQLRFTDEFTFSIQNNCSNNQIEIPSMIVQPFIENALWHGLANKQGKKNITLIFTDDTDGISIEITDNGIGRKAATLLPKRPDKQSMGLDITKERLQRYSHDSSIEIIDLFDSDNNAAGTKVIIHLPHN
ncbi:histidine kinase [Ferruginibacter sp. SUN106]|uniref:histidine kinase n=1 Tax=Ferruginibacter sp. SUN106 TaxID=2978348 RepID=UPI003D35E7F1